MTDLADLLAFQCRAANLPYPVREYKFHTIRRWRFDLCWLEWLLFAEVDGGEWTVGRHARGAGMALDCEKWNTAMLEGWTGFRFTGSMVKDGRALFVLEQALGLSKKSRRMA